MSPSALTSFRLLSGEAFRDALRRRIVLVIAALSMLTLMMIDSCSGCTLSQDSTGAAADPARFGALVGVMMLGSLCVWIPLLAGILAADPLSRSLSDGSAALWLARPVSRESYVLAQLVGALGIALVAGAILLGCAALLLALRQGFPPSPVLLAAGMSGLNAVALASLAMIASLWLPRAVVSLLALVMIGTISGLELLALFGVELEGLAGFVVSVGPPLVSGPVVVLAGWVQDIPAGVSAVDPANLSGLWLRALVWSSLGVLALCVLFRRLEIRSR